MLTEPQKKRHYNTDDEHVFLAQQAADAKIAIRRTVADMQESAKEIVNVTWWTQHYPWYAVGAAAVLGFVAASTAVAPADHQSPPAPPAAASQAAARPSWKASLFETLRSALMGIIVDALHPKDQRASQARADASLS